MKKIYFFAVFIDVLYFLVSFLLQNERNSLSFAVGADLVSVRSSQMFQLRFSKVNAFLQKVNAFFQKVNAKFSYSGPICGNAYSCSQNCIFESTPKTQISCK
jgi:hypothetical protein